MIINETNYLAHYGILRRSGRYPWGSGKDQHERNKSFLDHIDGLRKQGLTDTEIARGFGITTTQLRAANSIAIAEKRHADILLAQRLKDKGWSNTAIAERMYGSASKESTVRALLAPSTKERVNVLQTTANMLKDQVDKKNYIDIGAGTENLIGISQTKLSTAVAMLQEEGYKVHYLKVQQLGTGKFTTIKVLSKPGVPYSEVFKNKDKVQLITEHTVDSGNTYLGLRKPASVDLNRVAVRYGNEGGSENDGVIFVRPGVDDISMGSSRYAQVRIAVDGTHYLKGMAVYKDDLPPGVDLLFNTNKNNTGNKLDALKELKKDKDGNIDWDNPFGAAISRQNASAKMNIVNEDVNWEKWSKTLSSQFLSKQSPSLAKSQLDMTYERRKNEFDEIMSLTNPEVRRKLLMSYADSTDSASVHLKAAALPRQANKVILPINSLKDTEVYAPTFKDGERVVLVRFPHGGTFEIPELTVNNKNKDGRNLLGEHAEHAIGINHKVAERLSGADFDGDTVLVIPNNSGRIKTSPALEGLKNFNPQVYKLPADSPIPKITNVTKQHEMGRVSNLITDMTIQGAGSADLARAVRHSMVVIDAEKHNLNYRQSAIDNGITQLKEKYQNGPRGGASTIVSRKKTTTNLPERKDNYRIDPITGKKIYSETGSTYTDKKGKTVTRTQRVNRLASVEDANVLSSGTPIEKLYADHSNKLKSLADQARKEAVNTKPSPSSPSAKKIYAPEVERLNSALNIALKNAPIERQAQLLANTVVSAKRHANPDMDASDLKKIKNQALTEARIRTGAKKQRIVISDREWEAIQAGAISASKLNAILNNADLDQIKQLATPRTPTVMTKIKQERAKSMLASGYTQADVAAQLGVALSTLKSSLSENGGE